MALTDNLVEFWTLNNTRIGAVAGKTLLRQDETDHYSDPGKIGQAWDFANDPNRSLYLDAAPPNPGATDWSCSFWFRLASTDSGTSYAVLIKNTADDSQSLLISIVVGAFSANLRVTAGVGRQKSFAKDTNWHHGVIVRTSGSSVLIYVDGASASLGDVTVATATTPQFRLGSDRFVTIGFNGELDAVGWWTRALSPEDVAALYNSGAGWEYSSADNTPDAFSFTSVTDADPSTVYVSDSQTIIGMDAGTAVSITGGEYRINGGAWTAAAGTIDPGQTLELRGTSSAESEGVVTVTVTVGSAAVDWTITTKLIASVVTTILWGSTPDTSRILSSRIVRGAL